MDPLITSEQAKSLAVRYHAFLSARLCEDPAELTSLIVWGGMLRRAQDETGVEVHPTQIIDDMVRLANDKRDRILAQPDFHTAWLEAA